MNDGVFLSKIENNGFSFSKRTFSYKKMLDANKTCCKFLSIVCYIYVIPDAPVESMEQGPVNQS